MAAVTALPALALFVGATTSLQPDDTILGGSLTGAVLAQLIVAVLGALAVTSEHGSTLGTTLAATPRRATVLAAKALTVAAVVFPTMLVAGTAAYLVGDAMLADGGYARGEPMPALVGVAACLTLSALLGMGLGTVLRRSAGAIAAVVGVVLLPSLIGPLFGDLQRWVVGATPSATLEKLTQTSDARPDVVGGLGAWPSLAVLAGTTAVVLGVAAVRFARRDA